MTENLTRAYQKIFAKNAGAQGKTVFGSTAQGNTQYTTDISTMQSKAYENGFADAVVSKKAPVLQDFNTVENITTRQLAYLFQKGIPEWNEETTYFKGNIVLNIESDIPVLYYSLIDNNLNNQVSDTESWKKVPLDINIDNKANTDLNNLSAVGKETLDYLSLPSNRILQLSLQAAGTTYTAPGNGWVYFYCTYQSGDNIFADGYNINNGLGFHHFFSSNKSNDVCRGSIPCKKGDTFIISYYANTITNVDFKFVYAEGSY